MIIINFIFIPDYDIPLTYIYFSATAKIKNKKQKTKAIRFGQIFL